jgi:hypothetical protein
MAGPAELAEMFITAGLPIPSIPLRRRHQIRQTRLGFPTPAHTPEQGRQSAHGKRPAASHARAALA